MPLPPEQREKLDDLTVRHLYRINRSMRDLGMAEMTDDEIYKAYQQARVRLAGQLTSQPALPTQPPPMPPRQGTEMLPKGAPNA